MAAPRWASDKRPATGTDTNTAYGTVRPSGKFRPRIQIGGVTDFGKSGSEADFTPPDLPLQIKNCPSQRFYLGRSEKTVIVTSTRALADSLQHATGGGTAYYALAARRPDRYGSGRRSGLDPVLSVRAQA